jgi:beta-phosphoglucomutase
MMTQETIRAVLFDLDGVIVFTDTYHFRAWKRLAGEEGWEFSEKMNHRLRGVSRMESLEIILDENDLQVDPNKKREWAERKNRYYADSLMELSGEDVLPGALETVELLKNEGYRTALCSSSKNAGTVLDALGITGLFEALVTGWDIERTKPDPQIFLLASEKLREPPPNCAVFEDADSGIEAAHRAGMYAVGVGDPGRLPGADVLLTEYRPEEVLSLLRTLPDKKRG